MKLVACTIAGLFLCLPPLAQAEDRQKVIDFEDQLVEGVNKQPLDSLNQISEKDKSKKRPHLYRKRASFKSETERVLQEMRLGQ